MLARIRHRPAPSRNADSSRSSGIDWKKVVHNTPSGREYVYVDSVSLGGSEMMFADEIAEVFA